MIHLKNIPAKLFGRAVLLNADIDRDSGLITVRVKRQHQKYELPLGLILSIVYERGVQAEVREKKKDRKRQKRKE